MFINLIVRKKLHVFNITSILPEVGIVGEVQGFTILAAKGKTCQTAIVGINVNHMDLVTSAVVP